MQARISGINVLRDIRFRREVLNSAAPLTDLTRYERGVFSQNGEDGILEAIFARIGTTNRYFVEFGCEDGSECNTRLLAERHGWSGLLMDGGHEIPARNLRREFIRPDNVNALFDKHGVPGEFDLLCIDIDSHDYWVWRALEPRWRPRVAVVEYITSAGPTRAASIPYDPSFRWDGTDYMGCSLGALVLLGARKGYRLVGCDWNGVNAFFVREDLADPHFPRQPVERLFRPSRFGPEHRGHLPHPTLRMPDLPPGAELLPGEPGALTVDGRPAPSQPGAS